MLASPIADPSEQIITLIVDDSDFDRQRIARLSQRSKLPLELHEVPSLADMKTALLDQAYDVIILDYQLTDGDGLSALNLIKSNPLQKEAGLIMVTGNQRRDIAVSAFRRGYHDFMSKEDMTADTMRDAILRSLRGGRHGPTIGAPADALKTQIQSALTASLQSPELQQVLAAQLGALGSSQPFAMGTQDRFDMNAHLRGLLEDDDFLF